MPQKKQDAEEKKARKNLLNATYCITCGATFKKPKSITKGSIFVEFFLWCCFILPGLIYSIWRLTSRYPACPECKSPAIVPANSPIARKALGL